MYALSEHALRAMNNELGPASDHFDGRHFFNPGAMEHCFIARRRGDWLRWMAMRKPTAWTPVTDFTPPAPPPARSNKLAITWINHSTVLIQVAGHNIITDPIYAQRVGPLARWGPRRYHPPGVAFKELPAIDSVLISHAHYDHLDYPTVAALARRDDPLFVAGLGLRRWFKAAGAKRVATLDWWRSQAIDESVCVTGTPARHASRRSLRDANRSLWLGYWITTPAGGVYFAGDTGMGGHFKTIRARLGAPRVALLPIGSYVPRWFMAPRHINPQEAVAAHQTLGVDISIGIHFATFQLADEARFAPAADLAAAADAAGLEAGAFRAPAFGERFVFD
jgi:L-ascorbate metabolism protein UlaG (beta-lactamase superfamily)